MFTTTNPATEQTLATYEFLTDAQLEATLEAAARAQRSWRDEPVAERSALLRSIAARLRDDREPLAQLITQEMGKPIREARSEVEKSAVTLDYYADNGADILAFEQIPTQAQCSGVRFDPLGVVLAIMPWNYPLWQFFRFAAPALIAGNAALLKHAANVAGCAERIMAVLADAGVPEGLVGNLMIDTPTIERVIADRRVAAVTLTGSTRVGAIVAAQAGSVLKKQVLELGGSDPFIVLADADLEAAATVAVKARFTASGQSCVNAKRFIVVDKVADEFVRLFVDRASELVVGDPTDETTDVGPLARADLRDAVADQVRLSIEAGAEVALGGEPLPGPGYFYRPTILDRVPLTAPAACEETFGPAAAVIRVADEDEAIQVANDTDYGLGASLWTQDRSRAEILASRIEAGAVFVNAQVASDARLPFGGIKRSGYGRELSGYGLREFANIKTIWID